MNFDEINSTEKYGKWRELTIQYMDMVGYTPREVLMDFGNESLYAIIKFGENRDILKIQSGCIRKLCINVENLKVKVDGNVVIDELYLGKSNRLWHISGAIKKLHIGQEYGNLVGEVDELHIHLENSHQINLLTKILDGHRVMAKVYHIYYGMHSLKRVCEIDINKKSHRDLLESFKYKIEDNIDRLYLTVDKDKIGLIKRVLVYTLDGTEYLRIVEREVIQNELSFKDKALVYDVIEDSIIKATLKDNIIFHRVEESEQVIQGINKKI